MCITDNWVDSLISLKYKKGMDAQLYIFKMMIAVPVRLFIKTCIDDGDGMGYALPITLLVF